MINWLRWVGGLGCLCLGLALIAHAQQVPSPGPPTAIACAFNTSPPTVASGNAIWVQCDTNGKLIVSESASSAITANQGTANTIANGWPVKVTDGTNTANVEPASEAPDATDSALVVSISPNGTLPAGTNLLGSVTAASSGTVTNPTSTLTLPAATTAYTAGQLIANSATAGSVVVPSFAIANTAGGAIIPRLRLSTNDATATGWGAQTIQVDLWSVAPTFTNGDRAAWLPATGSASHLAAYTCTMAGTTAAVWGDGIAGECSVSPGNATTIKLASGTSVFWTLDAISGSGVTGVSKVFTLTAELLN